MVRGTCGTPEAGTRTAYVQCEGPRGQAALRPTVDGRRPARVPRRVYMSTRRHANLLVLFAELDAGLGCVQRVRHLLQRIAQAGHNAHAGHDDSSVALPRTVARHETGTPDKHGGSRFEHPFWRTTPICSCVDLGVVWLALRDTDAGEGDTSRPTTLEAASSNATMLASVRQELRGGSTQNSRGLENVRDEQRAKADSLAVLIL